MLWCLCDFQSEHSGSLSFMEIEVLGRMIIFVMPLAYIGEFNDSSLAIAYGTDLISIADGDLYFGYV